MSRGAEAGAAAASDLRQTVKNSSISAQHSDFVATETFQLSVPAPSRALRKSNERSSRTIHEMPVLYCERYFASVRHDLSQSVASLQPDAHRPLPSHSADYLKFGILVISPSLATSTPRHARSRRERACVHLRRNLAGPNLPDRKRPSRRGGVAVSDGNMRPCDKSIFTSINTEQK